VNLNELEFSEANFPRMKVHGYEMKHELSYGVKGADPVALRILGRKWRTTVHYCTSGYKDGWQLRSRIKRRAETVAHPWDVITKDGTLLKGIVEGSDLEPLRKVLEATYHVPPNLMGVDGPRKRLEIAPWILEEIAPKLRRPAFLVEEYPTADGLEVERLGWRSRAPRASQSFRRRPAPRSAGPAAIRADEALQPTGPRVEPHVRPRSVREVESEVSSRDLDGPDRTQGGTGLGIEPLHGFREAAIPLRHDRAEQLLRSSGSDSRSSSIVRSKYPKIRRTSSSKRPRLRVRNRSTSPAVIDRRDSAASRYPASRSTKFAGTPGERCGMRSRSGRFGSTAHAHCSDARPR